MNESIEVRFRKNSKRLLVTRQRQGGIEFDESDPLERTIGIQFKPLGAATEFRVDSVRRNQGWDPGQFRLNVSVEEGSLILRGVNQHSLPEGKYRIQVQVEEAKTKNAQVADVPFDGRGLVVLDLEMDDRDVDVDLTDADLSIRDMLQRSRIDGASGLEWLDDDDPRPTRQACLLNLSASLRTQPTKAAPLISLVDHVFLVANDRIYAKVDRRLLSTLETLAEDPDNKVFYAEGEPHAKIHERLLDAMPEPSEVRARFGKLTSFRAEGRPSMQAVVAIPPPGLGHTYAEFDLDLGNPLQDVVGFFVHMGELLDGKPTNHIDLRKQLIKTKAKDFLYYKVVSA